MLYGGHLILVSSCFALRSESWALPVARFQIQLATQVTGCGGVFARFLYTFVPTYDTARDCFYMQKAMLLVELIVIRP